jgi:nitrite reductase (NADH) small subunit
VEQVRVGRRDEFKDGDRKMVAVNGAHVGVLRIGDDFVAYGNVCPHQGGPVCEGLLIHKVEEVINEDRTFAGMTFNTDTLHLTCPWHGWAFDARTGVCAGDPKQGLRKYPITERDGEIFVSAR